MTAVASSSQQTGVLCRAISALMAGEPVGVCVLGKMLSSSQVPPSQPQRAVVVLPTFGSVQALTNMVSVIVTTSSGYSSKFRKSVLTV